MSTTRFTGPIKTGDILDSYTIGTANYTANVGFAVLSQTAALTAAGATTVTATVWLPQQSQIIAFNVDTLATWSGVTTFITIGTPTNATAYLASSVINTAAPARPVLPAASFMVATMANIGTTPAVVMSIQQVTAGNNTTGAALVTIVYAQTTATFS